LAEPVEAAAHTGVEAQRAGLEDDAADQVRVDASVRGRLEGLRQELVKGR